MCPQAAGLVKSDSMNVTQGRTPRNYSTFDHSLSYKKNMLLRYADYSPSFEMEGVPDDNIRLNTKDFIDSLSLNAPFKGTIRKIKESFKVPNMAFLPFNWDQIYTQPSVGDDVPSDANTVIRNFPRFYSLFWDGLFTSVCSNVPISSSTKSDIEVWLTALMRCLVLGEYVYSKGSLCNFCGYKGSSQFEHLARIFDKGTFDQFFDEVVIKVFSQVKYFELIDDVTGRVKVYHGLYSVPVSESVPGNFRLFGAFRSALDAFRENPLLRFYLGYSGFTDDGYTTSLVSEVATLVSDGVLDVSNVRFLLPPISVDDPDVADSAEVDQNNFNYSRLLAYQLVYFHFYTNSSIDPVYSAELYRQYVKSFYQFSPSQVPDTFTINGTTRQYDFLSGYMVSVQTILTRTGTVVSIPYARLGGIFDPTDVNLQGYLARFAVLAAIFATRHSLRYGDYFVGSRPRPIAPVNSNVAVFNNQVSVIDITQKTWNQRFGNAIMRSRQKIEEYVDMLFGKKPDIDYHNPIFLAREVDVIYGDEVQNTAAAQASDANSRTANMRGGLGQFTFTFHNDDAHPCVYIQIISFDIKRAYTRSVDRQFLIADRFDMFNPAFQYVGDQPIYGIEIGYPIRPDLQALNLARVFAYTSRDMEYKQRFDVCCGGFEDQLPGWVLTDIDRSRNHDGVLDADFIRNENSELDKFFLSLTGFSLGSYFHFVCITQNNVYAKRAMAVDPQIMG